MSILEDFINKIRSFDPEGKEENSDNLCVKQYYDIYSGYSLNGQELEDLWDELPDKTDEDEESWEKITEYLSDYFSDIVNNWYAYKQNIAEELLYQGKYYKTSKRIGNVVDISWENLSDVYKIYLLSQCGNKGEISLFDLSATCQAILDCKNFFIKSNTGECIVENPKHSVLKGRTRG